MKAESGVTPAVVFGFPNVDIAVIVGEGVGIPFYVGADRVSNCSRNLRECAWAQRPVRDEATTCQGCQSVESPV